MGEQGVSLAILSLTLLLTQLPTLPLLSTLPPPTMPLSSTLPQPTMPLSSMLPLPMLPLLSMLPLPTMPPLSRLPLDTPSLTLLRSPPTPTTMLSLTTTLEPPSSRERPMMATVLFRDLTLSTSLGRVQTVNCHANDYDGFVSEVSYEGTAAYPEAVPVVRNIVAHAPLVAHAPVLAHPLAHAVGPAVIG